MQVILNLSSDHLTDCEAEGTSIGKYPRAIVTGVRNRYQVIETADMKELAGFVVRPGGFAGLFRERADLFFQRSIALEDLWNEAGVIPKMQESATPGRKLGTLDALLVGLIRGKSRRSDLANHALYLFKNCDFSVSVCARSIGVSERRLSQVFREEIGVSPRLWCRIRRFQSAARALHAGIDIPWAELALSCGYYDQSHFANDFRAFSGVDARTYSRNATRWQNHVPISDK
jgi:AraC-like DNA-binding protein